MANTINFILTNAADELIPKILNGKTLKFTRIAVGDGYCYTTAEAIALTMLVNEVLSLDITKQEIETSSSVKVTSAFTSSDLQKEFYYREVGLFAEDPDTGNEVLYAYGNRNDAAELITPAGSSSVSKKLVFVVKVGDSANVTFNVNADVYALQSDMLDVQENKANKDLSNTGMITNCLLEVPQDIKLELNDGVLTLKAGSKVYFPNGYESDGTTKRFDEHVTEKDLVFNVSTENKTYITGMSIAGATYRAVAENVYSQATEPTSPADLSIWYDTTNNVIKRFVNGVWTEVLQSLPFCISTWANGLCTSIDQIFNGMGFIGSTTFALPGVKGLIPNGRNTDGTLKTEMIKLSSVILGTAATSDGTFFLRITSFSIGIRELYMSDTGPTASGYIAWYSPIENMLYTRSGDNAEWLQEKSFIVGQCECQSSKFVSISMNKPFSAVDYNYYDKKIKELEKRISVLEAN